MGMWLSASESSVNVSANTSVVTVTMYYSGNGVSWDSGGVSGYITIAGTKYSFSGKSIAKNDSSRVIYSASKTITHNSNGAATVSYSGQMVTHTSAVGSPTASGSKTLTTIPRVSDLTLSASSVAAGGSITATGTKKSSSFTDTIVLTFGSGGLHSQTLTSGTAFTIPLSWLDAIPNATSSTATVTLTTKSGSTTIGSTSKTFTITAPDSVVPTISAVSMAEANTVVTTAFGSLWLKLLSQVLFTITAAGAYGSSISKYTTTFDSATYDGSSFTSNAIKTAGTITATVTVTDSRGRTASTTKSITVIDYEYPAITDVSCPTSGTTITVTVKGRVSPVSSKNTKTLIVKYKKASDASWTTKTLAVSSYDFTSSGVSTTISGIDNTATYDIQAELTDKIATTTSKASTGIVALSLYPGGKGAAFFGEASREGLVMYGDILFDDDTLEAAWNAVFG